MWLIDIHHWKPRPVFGYYVFLFTKQRYEMHSLQRHCSATQDSWRGQLWNYYERPPTATELWLHQCVVVPRWCWWRNRMVGAKAHSLLLLQGEADHAASMDHWVQGATQAVMCRTHWLLIQNLQLCSIEFFYHIHTIFILFLSQPI